MHRLLQRCEILQPRGYQLADRRTDDLFGLGVDHHFHEALALAVSTMIASNFSVISVGGDVWRVVDDQKDQVLGAGVVQAMFCVRGDLDESAWRGRPAPPLDLQSGGAAEEVERVVVIVVMGRRSPPGPSLVSCALNSVE